MPLLGYMSHQTKSAVLTITVFVLALGMLVGAVCYSHNNETPAAAPIATPAAQATPVADPAPVATVVDAGSEAASEVNQANSLAAAASEPVAVTQPEEPPKPRMWFWGDDVVTRAGTTWYVTDVKAHATCAPIPINALQEEDGYLQSQGLDSFKRINDAGEPDLQVMQVATIALSAHPTMESCQKHLTDDRRMQGFGQ